MSGGAIFIAGLSFSGKTPVRVALGAHPRLDMTRHTAMWGRFDRRFGDLRRPRNLDRCLAALVADEHVARLEPDRQRLRQEFVTGPATYARLYRLVHEHHAERVGKPRWGEQLGLLERYADVVLGDDPASQMVHMIRDPRSRYAAASVGRRRLVGDVGPETARWIRSARIARRHAARYPDRYLVVRYETLLADPEATIRRILSFLGEHHHPRVLEALATTSLGRGTAGPPTSSAGPRVHRRDRFIERHARREMASLGYGTPEEPEEG